MSRKERDGSTGCITVYPKEGTHSATIIMLHGLGDSAEGFSDVADMWTKSFPYIKIILPTAVSRPVTLNGGMRMPAWYDIVGLDERAAEQCNGIDASCEMVTGLIKNEVDSGIYPNRIILAGFSQGIN